MKIRGMPRALLAVVAVAVAILAGIGTAGSFTDDGSLWGGQEEQEAGAAETRDEMTLRGPAIRASLDSLQAAYMNALENGDHETLAGFYAEDAVYFPAMAPPVRGRDALRTHLEEELPDVASAELKNEEVLVLSPEWVATHGTVVLRLQGGEDAAASETELSYALLLHKTDAGWKIERDVGSANAPPGGGQ